MSKRCATWLLIAVPLWAVAPVAAQTPAAAAQPASAAASFTLGRYVPQDFWMYLHGVHNPERDFVDAHWTRVWDEVRKSGVDNELKKLIVGALSETDRAEFERGWDKAVKLFNGVHWGDLFAKEIVFAERLGALTPDLVVLCRSADDSVATNLQGLKDMLDAVAALSDEVKVTEDTVRGLKVWTLGAEGFPMTLHVFNQGNIIGIVAGAKAMNEVVALLTGDKSVTALVDTPRFQKAMKELPPPEDMAGFFDFQLLMRNLDQMFTSIFEQHHPNGGDSAEAERRGKQMVVKLLGEFNFFDYSAMVSRTDGLREVTTSTARVRADALDKPLCRMVTARKPFARFDQYIPQNAAGFSVSSFIDLEALYGATLDFIRQNVPEGEAVLAQWAELQKGMDFDIKGDLFSWWSGEMVSVSLPPAVAGPFASEDFVLFIRVKDGKLAAAKVNAGIDRLATLLREHEQNLMLADVTDVQAEGFRSITHPIIAMQGLKFLVGVVGDQLVISNSSAGINACLATAAGKAPSIASNERFKKEGLTPKGPVCSASFSDLSKLGQQLGTVFFMVGMAGQMIPDEPETRPIKAIIGILGRLSPAINKIDFFSSSASVVTFDGQAWSTEQVLNYKPTPPPTSAPATPGTPATPAPPATH